MQVTATQLRVIAGGPAPLANKLATAINRYAEEYEINTPLRMAHFLAHGVPETGGYRTLVENMNYSAKRLTQVWPSRFPTIASAKPYAKNPQALANKVYGGRLGNTGPDDGWTYRGSGFFQTTGKDNFERVRDVTGFDCVSRPELLREVDGAVQSAMVYFRDRVAKYADRDQPVQSRKAVNGGTHGLKEFKDALARAKKQLSASPPKKRPPPENVPMPMARPVAFVMTEVETKAYQERLRELGYLSVGKVDGDIGGNMVGAVSAFQFDNSIPVSGQIDEATRQALAEDRPKPISEARANTTVADLREQGCEEILETDQVNKTTFWTMITGFVGSLLAVLKDWFETARDIVAPVADLLSGIHPAVYFGIIFLLAFYLSRKSKKLQQHRVENERAGAHFGTAAPADRGGA